MTLPLPKSLTPCTHTCLAAFLRTSSHSHPPPHDDVAFSRFARFPDFPILSLAEDRRQVATLLHPPRVRIHLPTPFIILAFE